MKKLIVLLLLSTLFLFNTIDTQAQVQHNVIYGQVTLLTDLNLSSVTGADTTLYVSLSDKFPSTGIASIRYMATGVDSTASDSIGYVQPVFSIDGTNFFTQSTSPKDNLNATAIDSCWNITTLPFKCVGVKIYKGDITNAVLNVDIFFRQ